MCDYEKIDLAASRVVMAAMEISTTVREGKKDLARLGSKAYASVYDVRLVRLKELLHMIDMHHAELKAALDDPSI